MSWTPSERETVINLDDEHPLVRIWTAQRPVITRLDKDPRFTCVRRGDHSAEFTIPVDQWNPATGAKRKSAPMTPERRAEVAARFAAARGARR